MDRLDKEIEITLKNDYVFKRLLGAEENKEILEDFLECMFELPRDAFVGLELLDKELKKEQGYDKTGVLDIKVRLRDGMRIDIEMQSIWDATFVQRSLFYVAKMYIEDFKTGMPYSELNKCVGINIIGEGFNLNENVHSIYVLKEKKDGYELCDFIEFHFFNLEKVRSLPILCEDTKENRVINRLKFINATSKEERKMLANMSPALKILNDKMEELTFSPEERALYESRMKLKSDIASIYENRFNEGMRQGIERGMRQGIEKGIERGIERGREEGKREGREEGRGEGDYNARVETARKCLELKMPLETIRTITGLSEEEITKL